ncbi:MAG: sensor histidine kinase, partial [Fidelibacterota bacterium]
RDLFDQVRALSSRLQIATEEERTRIAHEIHDELGQALTAIRIGVSFLKKELGEVNGPSNDRLDSIMSLIDSAIETVKNVSTELRPPLLDDVGLSAAVEWQAVEFEKRTGIQCDLRLNPEEIIVDKRRSTAVFRIFQEALTNVARHARATKVTAVLQEKGNTLLLKVKDNGVGIRQEQIESRASFGLLGMRQRLYPWRGNLSIEGKPGKGTLLEATVPAESKA